MKRKVGLFLLAPILLVVLLGATKGNKTKLLGNGDVGIKTNPDTVVTSPGIKADTNKTEPDTIPLPQIPPKENIIKEADPEEDTYFEDPTKFFSDVLVSTDSYAPRGHVSLAKYGSSTVYAACEEVYSGYPAIRLYRSTDAGLTWSTYGNVGYSTTYNIYYPRVVVTSGYVTVFFDARAGDSLRVLQCVRRSHTSTTSSYYVVDDASSPEGYGMADAVTLTSNTIGCVYNHRYTATDWDVCYKTSTDGGATWGTRVNIHGTVANSNMLFRPAIWRDRSTGRLDVTFYDATNNYVHYSKSTNNGSSWTTGWWSGFVGTYPDIASYGNTIIIPHRRNTGSSGTLYLLYTTDGGTNWYSRTDSWGSNYPKIAEGSGLFYLATAYNSNAYYSYGSSPTSWSSLAQIDDAGVTVYADVVGVCEDPANPVWGLVAWKDSRNSTSIYMDGEIWNGVEGGAQEDIKPNNYVLQQSTPNPTKSYTTIKYTLPKETEVSLKIFNTAGQLVKIINQGTQAAGYHQVQWNCRDEKGDKVSAGVYVYRLSAGEYEETKKMVVLR